jgi:oligopeptide/dipeptide ABC transporter ATP-binding protein
MVVEALHNVSFTIAEKENYGLIGESGAGKSTIALSLLRSLPQNALEKGKIFFQDQDITTMTSKQLRVLWGKEIAFVPQDALAALNPSLKIRDQIEEVLKVQPNLTHNEVREISLAWLAKVHLAHPAEVASKYPHQLSGGMLQRVMLAIALCKKPRFVILDEPTSQLDVTTQGMFLSLLKKLIEEENLTVLYISHNLKLIRKICTRIGVLFSGELIEEGEAEDLFNKPLHPYTQTLLSSIATWDSHISAVQINPPKATSVPSSQGCRYLPHCSWAENRCKNYPPMEETHFNHKVRCFRWQDVQQFLNTHVEPTHYHVQALGNNLSITSTAAQKVHPFIKIENLSVSYPASIWKLLPFYSRHTHRVALHNADLIAYRDRTLGVLEKAEAEKPPLLKLLWAYSREPKQEFT